MSKFTQGLAKAKNIAQKGALAASVGVMTAVPAFADESAVGTAITNAFQSGQTHATSAMTGVIGLVAIVVGIGVIISLFKKA